jgi:hypothetical protein
MHVQDMTTMSLVYHTCRCGSLEVDGFWNQLKTAVSKNGRAVYAALPCRTCGYVTVRRYRLTSGKRKRLFSWVTLAWWLILNTKGFFNWYWWRWSFISLVFFLESRVRI